VLVPLRPLLKTGVITREHIVVNSYSGVSGAGKKVDEMYLYVERAESTKAYRLTKHRHLAEIEEQLALHTGAPAIIQFNPHLAPMTRGILATCYARPTDPAGTSTTTLLDALHAAYDDEPFVVVRTDTDTPPSTKATWGSNSAHVTARYDERTGWVVAIAAIDNLVKGASGQAVQCANILLGLDEAAGLSNIGVYP
jgi:N-acetyl-gamma-glutamyl-phosphate reductase